MASHWMGRRLRRCALGVCIALAPQWRPCSARADPPSSGSPAAPATDERPVASEDPAYVEAIDAGLAEYARGHYREARVHFERAHGVLPSARTLRALGNTDFELRNYGDAVRHLEAALASQVRPLDDELRATTERLLERARSYVGEVHIQIDPDSATVSVDGVLVARGPRASLALVVGEHVLEFKALDRLPERRNLMINSRDKVALEVVLKQPPEQPQPLLPTSTMQANERTHLSRRAKLWIGVGVAVAAIGAGIAIGLSTRNSDAQDSSSSGVTIQAP
jgi:tetratricopeptide (TPR) repeat protein